MIFSEYVSEPRTISVLTSALPNCRRWISETWASVTEQRLPSGWQVEWIVQEDGGTDELRSLVAGFTASSGESRLSYDANNAAWGTATTRNVALTRARGAWVIALDADDRLASGALAALVDAMEGAAMAAWSAGRTVYLREDGSTDPYPDRLPSGVVMPGWLGDDWLEHGRPAAAPGAFLIRRDVLQAFGGWMALRGSEDTGVLVSMSEEWEGRGVDSVVLEYRKWPGGTTSSQSWRDDHPRHQQVIADRLKALRRLRAGT